VPWLYALEGGALPGAFTGGALRSPRATARISSRRSAREREVREFWASRVGCFIACMVERFDARGERASCL
jgi:hypothetical protein